jgi:imidazolonepropionase-like amidohydrolase
LRYLFILSQNKIEIIGGVMGKTIIKAKTLYDGKEKLENRYITIVDDKITAITDSEDNFDFEGYVTPAFIDPHSHIGMFREGEPSSESEGNDTLDQFLPLNDPLNSIYFDDRAFQDAVDFGVLYSCVVPGSGNLFGGRAKIIRNWAKYRDEAEILDYGYKMALGYNPISTSSWRGTRPSTRMGVYALLEERFDSVIIKREKLQLELDKKLSATQKQLKEDSITKDEADVEVEIANKEFSLGLDAKDLAYLEVIDGVKVAKVHVHKEDDVLYLLDFLKKYPKMRATAEHTCDVFHKEIWDKLGEAGVKVIYGPIGGIGGKTELKHSYYQNVGLLMKSKAYYGLMTDHPVINSQTIRESLKFFMINGMDEADAINLITLKNATILGIDDRLGSIEVGKTGSIVVWDNNPFHLSAYPTMVMAEGKILRDNRES